MDQKQIHVNYYTMYNTHVFQRTIIKFHKFLVQIWDQIEFLRGRCEIVDGGFTHGTINFPQIQIYSKWHFKIQYSSGSGWTQITSIET